MVRIKDYMEVLYNAMKGIAGDVFLKDRPQAVSEKIDDFIVVDVSGFLNNKEMDSTGAFDYYTGQVYVSIFVRDKVTSKKMYMIDINKMDKLMQKVFEKFPIVDEGKSVMVYNPRLMVSSSDEDGWHYSLLQARLKTYF